MDEKEINISATEKEVLEVMGNASDITSEQLRMLMDNEECLQACCDIAEIAMEMQMEKNPLSIDTRQALADFHQKHRYKKEKNKNVYILWTSVAGVAATVIVLLVLRIMLFSPGIESESIKVFQADRTVQQVTLQVSDEEKVKPLKEAVQSLPFSVVQLSSQKIAYNTIQTESKNIGNKKVQIHKLSIPRGETFKVILSDGTEVLLNSDSRLSYPTVFKGKERIVSLEGEAYFSVTKDAEHPFIVKSGSVQVRVLGTEFNVRSYSPEDIRVTLIEGKVSVSDTCGMQPVEMTPGQSAQLVSDGTFAIDEIDTESLVYWKDGFFYFDNVALVDMMKEIGRWYNIDIEFRNSEIMNLHMHFLAKRQHNISNLIELLNRMERIHVYLEDEKLIIE
ncbi:FecR family protein [uncultured Bacteroides sp.]|uniref:FecR family protein n=1 Tax=uncultured Bacteroides sp. TaxID=162156 RepID=UPI000339B82F|nr:FecR family protein [uncultured Bacteroides sp.]CDA83986.1 sigma factor regulatory protein FecR/PupR family [Bacteroides sp. CAG:754]